MLLRDGTRASSAATSLALSQHSSFVLCIRHEDLTKDPWFTKVSNGRGGRLLVCVHRWARKQQTCGIFDPSQRRLLQRAQIRRADKVHVGHGCQQEAHAL